MNFFSCFSSLCIPIAALTTAIFSSFIGSCGNPDAKRLYDDLLSNYNKLVRPVVNVTDAVKVRLKLKLSQLIDVVSSSINPVYETISSFLQWNR